MPFRIGKEGQWRYYTRDYHISLFILSHFSLTLGLMFKLYRIASPFPSSPERAIGTYTIHGAASIASFLGLRSLGDLYRLLEGNGSEIDAGFPKFRIDIERKELLNLALSHYGKVSKYRLAGLIPDCRESWLYRLLDDDNQSDIRLSSLFRLLPSFYDRALFLDRISGYAAQSNGCIEPPIEGISSAVIAITGLMMKASGYGEAISPSLALKAMRREQFNPQLSTLMRCALFWGMPMRRIVLASEEEGLCLCPMPHLRDGNNSREALTDRICGDKRRADVIRLFDEWLSESIGKQLSYQDVDPCLSTLTMLVNGVGLDLSDIFEEIEVDYIPE